MCNRWLYIHYAMRDEWMVHATVVIVVVEVVIIIITIVHRPGD